MSTIKLVISDLHLADGHPMLEGFGDTQQAALEGLVNVATSDGPLGDAEDVELIINGDCFVSLAFPPYTADGITNVVTALEKLEKSKQSTLIISSTSSASQSGPSLEAALTNPSRAACCVS